MTGAGTANLAFAREQSFLGSLADPDADGNTEYWEPGIDPTITDLTLERALERQRKPDQVWANRSIAQNLEGAFGVEFTMDSTRQSDVHDAIFNGTSSLVPGRAQSSRWFIGLDYLDGKAERVPMGCVPLDYEVTYEQGGSIRVSITFAYADEKYNTSFSPSSTLTASGDAAQFHGMDLTLGGTVQSKEQSATLSISNMSRLQRGSEAVAVDAVVGPAQASLDVTSIFTETDQLESAYGGSGQQTTTENMSSVTGSLELSAAGSVITTYSLANLKPGSYSWGQIIGEGDTTESLTFQVTGDPAVSF